jgi:WD40 repeat protein/tRNA A-37 threonylcarbamoyl transferase component Bud32
MPLTPTTHYCISCGEEFSPPSAETLLCPACGGPPSQPAPLTFNEDKEVAHLPPVVIGDVAPPLRGKDLEVSSEWQVGDRILDTYEVVDIFTSGGMGLVYRVHHRGWKIELAVKSPRQKYFQTQAHKDNFIREAETWIDLGLHPNIVTCYYVRTIDGIPRLFAEFVPGGSLKDWIADGRLYEGGKEKALECILDIAIQFAWGLAYAHSKGLIHQDVKPANVLMTLDGEARVTDFGLAKARAAVGEAGAPPAVADLQVSYGGMTPAYCSPEQAEAAFQFKAGAPIPEQTRLTYHTDIWSWGVSLLDMFVGEPACPYGGQAAGEVLESLLEDGGRAPGLPAIPPRLADLLRACFQRHPQARPASLLEISERLQVIYKSVTCKPYPRQVPRAAELRADSLNNRALSYLDLGKTEQAVQYWQAALEADPQHLPALFNLNYSRWKWAEIGSSDLLNILQEKLEKTHQSDPDYWHLVAWIHLERGDIEAILELLDRSLVDDPDFLSAYQAENKPIGRRLRSFEGHTENVYALCFTADGRQVLSGSADNTLILWDVQTGALLRRYEGHSDTVRSLCLLPEGRRFISASQDKTLRLWDLDTGKTLSIFNGHTAGVNAVCVRRDGQYALSASEDGTLRLWDLSSGLEMRRFSGHRGGVAALALSPDGSQAVSGGDDKILRLWNLETGEEIRRMQGHTQAIRAVAFSPDGENILSASGDMGARDMADNTIRLWQAATGGQIYSRFGTADEVLAICFSPDGRYALAGNDNINYYDENDLQLWEVASGREIRRFLANWLSVEAVCFSPDGRYAVTGGSDDAVILWQMHYPIVNWEGLHPYPILTQVKPFVELLSDQERVERLASQAQSALKSYRFYQAYGLLRQAQAVAGFERDDQILASLAECGVRGDAYRSGKPNVWERKKFKAHMDYVGGIQVSFSPDGHYALVGVDYTLQLWDLVKSKLVRKLEGHTGHIGSISYSPDGSLILSGSWDHSLRLWDAASGKEIRRFSGNIEGSGLTCFSPDMRLVLSGGGHTLHLWDVASGRELRRFTGHTGNIEAICLSRDGKYALSGTGGNDQRPLRCWDISSGAEIPRFPEHSPLLYGLSFSPWDDTFLTAHVNGVLLWDLASGQEIRRFEGRFGLIGSTCFTPDGRFVLAGDEDGRLHLWDVQDGAELARIKEHREQVTSVCFSRDGRFALSGSEDDTFRLLEFDWNWIFP